jgi:hypothetical protein
LGEKQPTQSPAGIVNRCGRALEISRAGKPDQPVPQILPLSEDEDHEDDHNPGGYKRMNQGRRRLSASAKPRGLAA